MRTILQTLRLDLYNCDLPLIEAVLRGNAAIAEVTDWNVPDDWTEFGEPAFKFTQARLAEFPEDAVWWTWLPVIRSEKLLAGSCGYVGRPNAEGTVEIGYEIAASRRQLGLATEAVQALIDHAFTHDEVQSVMAHTLAVPNPSTRILRRFGFLQVAELEDPEEGKIWRWELPRTHYEAAQHTSA
jgi:[ribosomal protein S5]-alanine N-acetyltransferase